MDNILDLDPRYRDYLEKKKFYKENNITGHDLEKEYQITLDDKRKIREFFLRRKTKQDQNYYDKSMFVDVRKSSFLSEQIQDPRMERLHKKQQSHQDAKAQRYNYSNISRKYDMYRNDRPFSSAFGNDFTDNKFTPWQWFDETCGNTFEPGTVIFKENKIKPKRNKVDRTFASSNTYKMKNNYGRNTYLFGEVDQDYEDVVGEMVEKLDKYNVNVDNYLQYGEGDYYAGTVRGKSKSIGYRNPAEHYFSYISKDIQDPNHVVNPYGVSTRTMNRVQPKQRY